MVLVGAPLVVTSAFVASLFAGSAHRPATPAGGVPSVTAVTTVPASPAVTRQPVRPTVSPTARPSPARTHRATRQITTPSPEATEPVTGAGYSNCTELRHDYPQGVPTGHPAYEPKFDPDHDGWACETT